MVDHGLLSIVNLHVCILDRICCNNIQKVKASRNKPGVAQRVPEDFRLQDFHDIRHMKAVRSSAMHRPPLPPGNVPGTHFH